MARSKILERPLVSAISGTRDAVETAIEIAKKNLHGRWDGKLTNDPKKFNKRPKEVVDARDTPKMVKDAAHGC